MTDSMDWKQPIELDRALCWVMLALMVGYQIGRALWSRRTYKGQTMDPRASGIIVRLEDENAKLRADLESARNAHDATCRQAASLELQIGEQARALRNVQRALQRNENREINMGEAWALIKEAVEEKKPDCPHLTFEVGGICADCKKPV